MSDLSVRCCEFCNGDMSGRSKRARYCSSKCSATAWYQANSTRNLERCRAWRKANPERDRDNGRKWRAENKERKRSNNQVWRIANRERVRACERTRYHANPEKILERKKAQRRANPAKFVERNRVWRMKNPEKFLNQLARRRARAAGALGSHTDSEWRAITQKQRGKCAECGVKANLTRDHIVPLSLGGTDFAYNIQGLCQPCNSAKSNKLVDYAHASLFDRYAA